MTMRSMSMRFAALLLVLSAGAMNVPDAFAQEWEARRERIEIQRVKPEQPQKPTLRFLHENLEFLRARLDPLREVAQQRGIELSHALRLDLAHLAERIQAGA